MALEMAIVSTVAQTAGGTQDITSSDITDFSCAVAFIYGATALGTTADHARIGAGVCTKTEIGSTGVAASACFGTNSRDAQTNTAGNVTRNAGTETGGSASSRFLVVPSASAPLTTVVAACDAIPRAISGVANGVRLNWTTTPDAAYRMVFVLFGGTTAEGIRQLATTTPFGFRADVGICISTSGSFTTGGGTANNDTMLDVGFFANNSLSQGALAFEWNRNADPTDSDGRVYTAKCAGSIAAGTASTGAAVTAIGASDTTVTDPEGFCLAMQMPTGTSFKVVTETLPGSTGVASFTGLGFTPGFVLGAATLINADDTTTDGATAASCGLFAFTPAVNEFAGGIRADEGVALNPATTDTSSIFDAKALLLQDDAGATAVSATTATGVASGFSLNFATATAGRMVLLGIQLPTVVKVQNETVQITDAQVLLLASKLVTSETVLISDGQVMMEQVGVALEDSPRGFCTQGGPIKGMTAIGGAERAMSLS